MLGASKMTRTLFTTDKIAKTISLITHIHADIHNVGMMMGNRLNMTTKNKPNNSR